MNTLTITLTNYGQSFALPKAWIKDKLPGSLFAATLEVDPDATELPLTQPEVTPDVMQLLVDLSQGQEPTHHNPNLVAADRYLGIPSTRYYADPAYELIPNRDDPYADENNDFLTQALEKDWLWPYAYLILKGYEPTDADFIYAAEHGALGIVNYLLINPEINPAAERNRALRFAAREGQTDVVERLLRDPRVDPADFYNMALIGALRGGHTDVVDLLLADPKGRVNPLYPRFAPLFAAGRNGHVDLLHRLVSLSPDDSLADTPLGTAVDPDTIKTALDSLFTGITGVVYPNAGASSFFRRVVGEDDIEQAILYLEDKRVDPTDADNQAIRFASAQGYTDMVRLLVEHIPRLPNEEEVDLNAETPTGKPYQPLFHASALGRHEVVRLLLEDPRTEVEDDVSWGFRAAAANGHVNVVGVYLVDGRVDPTIDDNYALKVAHQKGYLGLARLLLADPRVAASLTPEEQAYYSQPPPA